MSSRPRMHVAEGTYYIVRRTHSEKLIFSAPEDYLLLEDMLPSMLKRTGARILAYCWMPDAMHLALQIDTLPVGDFMRLFTSHYAQRVHRRTGERGQYFRRPYQSALIDPIEYLHSLVGYLHSLPVRAGLASSPGHYLHSSYRSYVGSARRPFLDANYAVQLSQSDHRDSGAFARSSLLDAATEKQAVFERCFEDRSAVLGGEEFVARLPRRGRSPGSQWSLDTIAGHVARIHGVAPAQLRSRSRRRELVIARAVFAWYATERRVASLSEAGKYLGRSASSLTRAIARHQRMQPELFTLSAFAPLASPAARSTDSYPAVLEGVT
jgi:putative transposase